MKTELGQISELAEEAEEGSQTVEEAYDAWFMIVAGELSKFLPDLLAALGGEEKEG